MHTQTKIENAPMQVSPLPLKKLNDDLVTYLSKENYQAHDNDLFVAYASLIIYEQFIVAGRPNFLGQIYDYLKTEIYKNYEHYPKYSWAKNYFKEATNFALYDCSFGELNAQNALSPELYKFSNL